MIELINAIPFPTWLDPEAFGIPTPWGRLSVKWYGISFIVGLSLAYYYAKRVCENREVWIARGVPSRPEVVPNKAILEDYFFFALLGIMIGGRIGSILLYNTADYIENPLRIFQVWKGGMAFHGGLLGVGAAVWYLSRKYKISLGRIGDVAAIGAPIGIGIVRIANFINQELWGSATKLPWGVIFSNDQERNIEGLRIARHPTQLYESLLEGLVLWGILYIAVHKFRALTRPGLCVGIFLVGYGIFRVWVELYRLADVDIDQFGFLQRGQMYSLPMIIGGAFIIYRAMKKPPVSPKRLKEPDADESA